MVQTHALPLVGNKLPRDQRERQPKGYTPHEVGFGVYLAFPLAILLFDIFFTRKMQRTTLVGSALVTLYIFGATPLAHTALWRHITSSIRDSAVVLKR